MAHTALAALVRYLRNLPNTAADRSDHELLRHYIVHSEEEAFAALVRRHASLVWNVCRRLLDHEQDAEDAFQAVFLVLLHKATSLHVGPSLANWLHAVATRIAQKSRVTILRRRLRESRVETPKAWDPFAAVEGRDLRELLDEELERLPEKYRAPVVLCYLEGLRYSEAAQRLGWRYGTVCGRLARARELLRQRLTRRGLTLSDAALVAALAESASAPAATVAATMRMAALFALGQTVSPPVATLAQNFLHAMSLAKVKSLAALITVLGLLAAGTGWTAHRVLATAASDTSIASPMQELPRVDAEEREKRSTPQERPRPGADAKTNHGEDTPQPLRSLPGHKERITSTAFSPDGLWIATAGWDGTARVCDTRTGKEVRRWEVPASKWHNPAQLSRILFSPDSQWVVVAQQSAPNEPGVIVWNRRTGERVRDFPGLCAAITPDGKQIACGGWGTPDSSHGDIRLYELATGKPVRVILTPYSRMQSLTYSPDGQTLFAQVVIPRPPLGNGRMRLGHDSAEVRAWDPATGKERRTLLEGAKYNLQIALSPDGRTLAFGEALEEVATGKRRIGLTGHTQEVDAVAFSADGRTVATGSMDGTVRLWDLPSGKHLARLGKEVPRFGGGWILSVAFSPDGRTLVSGGLDKTALLWDVSRITGRRRQVAERSPVDLEQDWKALSGDAATGYAAIGRLISSPKNAIPFLEKQLQVCTLVSVERIERLIAELDNEKFAVRERASRELEAFAERAAPALRKALAGEPSLEVKRRLEALLDGLDGAKLSPEMLRRIRAVEALEAIGSPEARRLLDTIAAGPVEMRLRQEAKAALQRMTSRPLPGG